MPKHDEASRQALMRKLKLNPKAGEPLAVAADTPIFENTVVEVGEPPVRTEPAKHKAAKIELAPPGVDPHTMPVTDIVFDPRLLDNFPSLEGMGKRVAADHVFALYKSPGRNRDRNSLLWSRVGKFIDETYWSRQPNEEKGHTKKKIKASKEQAKVAEVLVDNGIKSEHLKDPKVLALLAQLAEAEEAEK